MADNENIKYLLRVAGMPIGATYDNAGNLITGTYATIAQLTSAITSAVHFKGSATYATLASLTASQKVVGDLYNVSNDFSINTSGAIGAPGASNATDYDAGTNVIWTADGWDAYGSSQIDVDSSWSTTSTSPLQNSTITTWRNSAFESTDYTTVKTATTATNLLNKPSLSFTPAANASTDATLTVTAGGKTSDAVTIGKVKSAFAADSATSATNSTYATKIGTDANDGHPAIGSSTQPVYVNSNGVVTACTSYANASVASAASATNATYATKIGSSSAHPGIGSSTTPVYVDSDGVITACGTTFQAEVTGAGSSVVSSDLTANKVVISDGNGKIAASAMGSSDLRKIDWVEDTTAKTYTMSVKQPDNTLAFSIVFEYDTITASAS